ncbi:MAG TPA: hypothetical protein VFL54_00170 [Gammaproteobacteria bacterium]|jgi:ABC-2 type transport system permease protein|nr:hypothetical protein [Gammaproteobacteria bacterium]
MKSFIYLVRREMWENRSVWLVPAVIGAIVVLAYITLISYVYFHGGHPQLDYADSDMADRRAVLAMFYMGLTALFNVVLVIVIIRYLLHCLYGDRRDRSILFWRSLPLSDTATVLSKLAVAMIIAPLVTFVILLAVQLLGAATLSVIVLKAGAAPWPLIWQPSGLLGLWGFLLVAFLVQSLWYLPFYGWLMMASAWARQAPVLWAALPPVVAGVIEAILFQTSHFFSLIGNHVAGPLPLAYAVRFGGKGFDMPTTGATVSYATLGDMLTSGAMWTGVAVGVVFVAVAIMLRRYRDDAL